MASFRLSRYVPGCSLVAPAETVVEVERLTPFREMWLYFGNVRCVCLTESKYGLWTVSGVEVPGYEAVMSAADTQATILRIAAMPKAAAGWAVLSRPDCDCGRCMDECHCALFG